MLSFENIRWVVSFWFLFLKDHMFEIHSLESFIHNWNRYIQSETKKAQWKKYRRMNSPLVFLIEYLQNSYLYRPMQVIYTRRKSCKCLAWSVPLSQIDFHLLYRIKHSLLLFFTLNLLAAIDWLQRLASAPMKNVHKTWDGNVSWVIMVKSGVKLREFVIQCVYADAQINTLRSTYSPWTVS